MKRVLYIITIFSISLLAFACSDSGNNPQNDETNWNAYNKVVTSVTRVIDAGLSSVFSYSNLPENVEKQYLPIILERIRLFSDSSACIMAFDASMVCVANPFNNSTIGRSYMDSTDSRGAKYFEQLYNAFSDFNEISMYGKNFYKIIEGKEYPIGYFGKCFTQNTRLKLFCEYVPRGSEDWQADSVQLKREIVRNVVSASALGVGSAFAAFVDDSSKQVLMLKYFTAEPRFLDDNSGYLFVDDMNHISICFPTDTAKEGTSLYDYTDSHGNYPVRMMVNLLKTSNCGWVEYYYTNPSTKQEQKKHVYVQRIEGTNLLIGAGCYE